MKHRHFPRYNDDADFTTNAPSYYEDLARKEKLIRLLAERIWGYEKILNETLEQIQERFRAWDKNLEDFPDDVKVLLQQWLDDGTLDHIINDTIFNWKLDTSIFEQFRDTITTQLAQTVTLVGNYGDSTSEVQTAVNVGSHIIFEKGKTYNLIDTIVITKPTSIDLNGATINFNLTSQIPAFFVKSDNVSIKNGKINVVGTVMGGSGHALNCISAGNQSDGTGYTNLNFKNLTLSTNRNDAGATIGIFGECTNVLIENITIPDNDRCRNIIGLEWGGTPDFGTGHPHNIVIRNIDIGRLTYPGYGNNGYGFAVWSSACYNVTIDNIVMEEAYGLVMLTRGDYANTYAPEKYKDLIGTGITCTNLTIKSFFGYAIRSIGSHKSATLDNIAMPAHFKNITAIGGKIGANNNFCFQVEQSEGVVLDGFDFKGDFTAGVTTGTKNDNIVIQNGSITGAETYGCSFGNDSLNPTLRNVHFQKNNKNGGTGIGSSAVVLTNVIGALIDNCTFGELGVLETQRHSITGTVATKEPRLLNNHTFSLLSGGIAYLFGASTNTDINLLGINNTSSAGITNAGGVPMFIQSPNGQKLFWSTISPVGGSYNRGDIVYYTNPVANGFIGAVCIESGTPGTWKQFGGINE